MNDTGATNSKRKYAQTRQLLKLALSEGLTQDEIARRCRVTQSTVSDWATGKRHATEQQVQWLHEQYGHRLNQRARELYLIEPVASVSEGNEEGVEVALPPPRYLLVQGPVVWRHTLHRIEVVLNGRRIEYGRVPTGRWQLHREGHDRFRLVRLSRREIGGADYDALGRELEAADAEHQRNYGDRAVVPRVCATWIEAGDDSARWRAEVEEPMTAAAVYEFASRAVLDEVSMSVHDRKTLVFRLLRAFVGLGIVLPQVERA